MPIKIRCACGNVLLAPEERVGQVGNCPACNRSITVELPATGSATAEMEASFFKASRDADAYLAEYGRPRKKSLITRLLTLVYYIFFLLVVAGIIALHYFPVKDIMAFKPVIAKKAWEEYRDPLLDVRSIQRRWWRSVVTKFHFKDK